MFVCGWMGFLKLDFVVVVVVLSSQRSNVGATTLTQNTLHTRNVWCTRICKLWSIGECCCSIGSVVDNDVTKRFFKENYIFFYIRKIWKTIWKNCEWFLNCRHKSWNTWKTVEEPAWNVVATVWIRRSCSSWRTAIVAQPVLSSVDRSGVRSSVRSVR